MIEMIYIVRITQVWFTVNMRWQQLTSELSMFLSWFSLKLYLTNWYVFIQRIPHPKNAFNSFFLNTYALLTWPCWRSSRRREYQLNWKLDPDNQRILTPSLSLECRMHIMPTLPTARAISRMQPSEIDALLKLSGLNV